MVEPNEEAKSELTEVAEMAEVLEVEEEGAACTGGDDVPCAEPLAVETRARLRKTAMPVSVLRSEHNGYACERCTGDDRSADVTVFCHTHASVEFLSIALPSSSSDS